jgi:hypothetical protein
MASARDNELHPLRGARRAFALGWLAFACSMALGWAVPGPPTAQARLFSPNSVWNKPLARKARIDSNSGRLVAGLVREVRRERTAGTGPWIQTDSYSTPLYIVGPNKPRVRVALQDGNSAGRRSLQRAFNRVPIPPRARPAAGSDAHMTVWQPSTDRLWEFWQAHKRSGRWHATWGGAMRHVSSDPGYYTTHSWPGSLLNWGSTASSLPVIGGTMRIKELKSRSIGHALAMVIPTARARQYSWPAQRTDGGGPRSKLPEGARLRLPAGLNLRRLHLPRIVLKMARAAKHYGMIVRDQSAGVGFFAEDPGPRRGDPYYGPHGLFGGTYPNKLLAHFPWGKLRLLKMSLCTNQSRLCRRR